MELRDRERFPDSRPAREESFKMYKDKKNITVRLVDLEEGWKLDKTGDKQVSHFFVSQVQAKVVFFFFCNVITFLRR